MKETHILIFIEMVLDVKPTSYVGSRCGKMQLLNAGWHGKTHLDKLTEIVSTFKNAGIRTSIFSYTDPETVEWAKQEQIVLNYTLSFCKEFE